MDEVEFTRAYNNLRVLIDHARTVTEADDQPACNVHVANAMLTIAAMLDGLNQRITDLQVEEDDE